MRGYADVNLNMQRGSAMSEESVDLSQLSRMRANPQGQVNPLQLPRQSEGLQRAGSLATFLGGAPKRKNTIISKPTQGFQDLDEDDFKEKEQAKRSLANELLQQMEQDRKRKAEEKRLFKIK